MHLSTYKLVTLVWSYKGCKSKGALRDDVVAFTFDLANITFFCCRGIETLVEICPINLVSELEGEGIPNMYGLDNFALSHFTWGG